MAIISPLAYTIANGDPVDATPVQANLSQIVQDVNANAAPIAGSASQQFLVATTTNPAGALPLAQAQTQFAAISGSSANTFVVASGTGSDAVPYTQMQAYVGSTSAPLSGSAGQTFAVAPAPAGSTDAPQISQTLGAGGTSYTDQTANRAIGSNYTNNLTRPLVASFSGTVPAGGSIYIDSYIGASLITLSSSTNSSGSAVNMNISAIIPVGAQFMYGSSPILSAGNYIIYEY